MDPEIGKVAVEVTTKVAESIVPQVVKTVIDFVTGTKGRKRTERATRDRRQGTKDRRISRPAERLRKGFWFEYQHRVEADKSDVLTPSPETRDALFQSFTKEALRYKFIDPACGALLEASTVVNAAIDVTWPLWTLRPEIDRKVISYVGEIAKYIASTYNVSRIDRRKSQRRKATAA